MQCKVWFLGKGMGINYIFLKVHFNKKKTVTLLRLTLFLLHRNNL